MSLSRSKEVYLQLARHHAFLQAKHGLADDAHGYLLRKVEEATSFVPHAWVMTSLGQAYDQGKFDLANFIESIVKPGALLSVSFEPGAGFHVDAKRGVDVIAARNSHDLMHAFTVFEEGRTTAEPQPIDEEPRRPPMPRAEFEAYIAEKVFTALGQASMCWEPRPGNQVFDSTLAKQVGQSLVNDVLKLYDVAVGSD